MTSVPQRRYDIVLYGATGFVGSRAAAYLAAHADRNRLHWAIAGRDAHRLEAVKQLLGEVAPAVDVLVADSRDETALDAMASRTRVLLNTAGPFARYGGPVVDACVRSRTHYLDITGETPWVRGLIDRHHERAAADGTRIIPCCGFDSVPSDVGSFLLARHIQRTLGAPCEEVKASFQMYGGFNGGTIASAIHLHESGQADRSRDPFLLDPGTAHSAEDVERNRDPVDVRFDRDAGTWVGPFVMGFINTRVVRRSAALYKGWDESYGPRFHYQEYTRFDPPLARAKAELVTGLVRLFSGAMARDTTRRLLKSVLPKPGSGPSERTMNTGWFTTELLGKTEDGRTARARLHHRGDPSNRATARFVCESALALALDAESLPGGPNRGGLLTPATGLGEVLAERLRRSGMSIEVR